nr:choice-of-anchor E domain-containing protein [uncultured Duganella sp.]
MKKMSKLMIAASAVTLALSANAVAGEKVVTSTSILDVEGNPGSLSFAKFDSSLGDLQSVKIELFSTIYGDINLENKGSSAATFTGSGSGVLTLVTAGGSLATENSASHVFHLGGYDGVQDFGGASGHTYTFEDVVNSNSATYSGNLGSFIGSGNYLAGVSGTSDQSLAGTGNTAFYAFVSMDAYAKVTYTYAALPVPEPETYAMLLAGLALVGGIARRRKSA